MKEYVRRYNPPESPEFTVFRSKAISPLRDTRLATVRLGSGSGVMCPNLNLHLMVRFCHVEFRDRYSPSFSVCFRPFSFILHSFPSILCYSPMLFYPLPSPRHTPLFRHTRSFRHIPSLRHILLFRHIPSHPVISVTSHLPSILPFISVYSVSSFHLSILGSDCTEF